MYTEQLYVRVKALPRVCRENTVRGCVSRANTARGGSEQFSLVLKPPRFLVIRISNPKQPSCKKSVRPSERLW